MLKLTDAYHQVLAELSVLTMTLKTRDEAVIKFMIGAIAQAMSHSPRAVWLTATWLGAALGRWTAGKIKPAEFAAATPSTTDRYVTTDINLADWTNVTSGKSASRTAR